MAPIPRLAAGPLSIITGALFHALSGPNSAPPTNGADATVWGTEYTGAASFKDLKLDTTLPSPISPTPSSNASSSAPSPTTTSSSSASSSTTSNSSLVYYNTATDSYVGCKNQTFSSTDPVAFMNPLQFGDLTSSNTTCGQWIQVHNRENTAQSTLAKVVGICDDCEYGSISLNRPALEDLIPHQTTPPLEDVVFDPQSNVTLSEVVIEEDTVLPVAVSPKDLVNIAWELSENPDRPEPVLTPTISNAVPTKTAAAETTTTTTTTSSTSTRTKAPKPTKTKAPKPTEEPKPPGKGDGKQYSGRMTWYSDTFGQCEQKYSQSDLIVAVNEAQMGGGKKLCGKKILLTEKGSDTKVVVTVVDMCPGKYCKFGDLDLSQAAFKRFASLGKGVLQLQWSFL
ncbi:hypothetical protein EC968_008543 [Mortierella alpina]|nr:hypothetical protein EC968_008543 [Mortierella alpina]